MKGTYILLMNLEKNSCIQVGKQNYREFDKGWYIYIGSALNSLEPRIARHFRSEKNQHWHIDYFLDHAQIQNVYVKQGRRREECNVASSLYKSFTAIPKFGCSDCSCQSHLYTGEKTSLEMMIQKLDFTEYKQ